MNRHKVQCAMYIDTLLDAIFLRGIKFALYLDKLETYDKTAKQERRQGRFAN
ncbi:hypothetical protein [Thaumasiovibrio sp. DFM-14]|uniref:hypothetical protein n=1 Tax=Thaumasiovibrio sp. DFM-14 TaxID=3384792 RepID=UPI0039A02C34